MCNAAYGQTGWLGVASISITTGNHISRGSVKLNDTYFAMAQYNTPAYRQLVTCQEVGHTFGLAHQAENFTNPNLGTCMDYTNSPGANQHPNTHDYDQLVTIYSHLDSFNTPTLAGPANPANHPAAWGKLVDGSATHGFGTFVREYAHGEYVVTHVLWV